MIKELELPARKKNILAKKGIETNEDLLNFLPRAYKDYRNEYTNIERRMSGFSGCFVGHPYKLNVKYVNKRSSITFKLRSLNDKQINVCIIGQNYMKNILEKMMDEEYIAVFGILIYEEPYGYSIMSPTHVCYISQKEAYKKIEPVYTKFEGISEDWMSELIRDTLSEYEPSEIDDALLLKHGFFLPSQKEAYLNLHQPMSLENIHLSQRRIEFEKLLQFSQSLREQERNEAKGTPVIINTLRITKDIIQSLPYDLTADQKKYVNEMIESIKSGKRVSSLIQGDVGCGKTLVAILMLFALAENNYQTALMAPTSILASQHYNQIKDLGEKYGIKTAYLDGSLKQSEKNKIYKEIESGEIKILVGTHSLTSDKLHYKNLGLVIIDEEHRFGVDQRAALLNHAREGVNTITMSATPIPRTLAGALHGSNTKIMDIHSMPAGRQPILSGIADDENRIFKFLNNELEKGRQVYVICPLIEDKEETTAESIRSVTETFKVYEGIFTPKYKIDSISGKLDPLEIDSKIKAFKNHETDILIATTVVEVGVNVPNASVIVIQNPERFGLAQLHQLRGRVGRGEYRSTCVLFTSDKENERLNTFVNCPDGFRIAEEDLKLRGAGDLTSIKQSGFTEVMDLIAGDPEFYTNVTKVAKELSDAEFLL